MIQSMRDLRISYLWNEFETFWLQNESDRSVDWLRCQIEYCSYKRGKEVDVQDIVSRPNLCLIKEVKERFP